MPQPPNLQRMLQQAQEMMAAQRVRGASVVPAGAAASGSTGASYAGGKIAVDAGVGVSLIGSPPARGW